MHSGKSQRIQEFRYASGSPALPLALTQIREECENISTGKMIGGVLLQSNATEVQAVTAGRRDWPIPLPG